MPEVSPSDPFSNLDDLRMSEAMLLEIGSKRRNVMVPAH